MSNDAPPDPQTLHAGDELPGGHRVEEELANGRLGAAYVVTTEAGERRAGSVLHREHVADLGEWFLSAASLREGIVHPHMPRTFATGTLADGRPVEITELLEGESLRDAVTNRSVPLPFAVVARVIREVAAALDDLHQRTPPILHRALTPENVLLTAPDGLVKLLGVGEADRPRIDAVRAAYQSPEALADIASLSARADVFVLASLAYEALTGRHAFSGTADQVLGALHAGERPSATAVRDDVPAAVDGVLHRCWELSPEKRPATAGEAARAISAALGVVDTGEVALPEEPTGNPSAPLRVVRRRNALLGPTVENARPDVGDPRSFLENVERTEVSTPAVPAPAPITARAEPAPKPTSERPPPKFTAPRSNTTLRGSKGPASSASAQPASAQPTSSPPASAQPTSSPPASAPSATAGATGGGAESESEATSEQTDRNVATSAASIASAHANEATSSRRDNARTLHDTLDTSSPKEVPDVVEPRASPFADDPRSTLQTSSEALGLSPPEPLDTGTSTLKGIPAPTAAPVAVPPTPEAPASSPASAASPSSNATSPPPSRASSSGGHAAASQPFAPVDVPATLPLTTSTDTLPLPSTGYAPSTSPLPSPLPSTGYTPPSPLPSPLPPPEAPPHMAPMPLAPSMPQAQPLAPIPYAAPETRPIVRHIARAPDDVAFPDEPTGAYNLEAAKPSPWRSPWVIASIFLANAIVIVGVAHAIAFVAAREPVVRVVQAPAPVCAPCSPCAACAPAAASPSPPPPPMRAEPTAQRAATQPRRATTPFRRLPAVPY